MKKHQRQVAKRQFKLRRLTLNLIMISCAYHVQAAELNTTIPESSEIDFITPVTLDIPAQPLSAALKQFSAQSELDISFNSQITDNKTAPAVKGKMKRKEALRRLLVDSGLTADVEGD